MRDQPYVKSVLFAAFAALCLALGSPAAAEPKDPLEPVTKPESAIAGPLGAVTVLTSDLVATRRFYQGALGMTPAFFALEGSAAKSFAAHYGFLPQARFTGIVFSRPGIASASTIRAIQVNEATAFARPEYDTQYVGALSMGFPVKGEEIRDAVVTALGFTSNAGITSITLPRADGSTYKVKEVHYRAPDGVLALGIDRADMTPVGPVDEALGLGGPAYSGAIVADAASSAAFMRDVLGFELRRDLTLTSSGPSGGLGLPSDTRFTFQQWYAPGARTGYIILMDLLNAGKPAPQPLGTTLRGLGMWSFPSTNINVIFARARAAKARILSAPTRAFVPGIGPTRSMIVAMPDGFPVEVYQVTRSETAINPIGVR